MAEQWKTMGFCWCLDHRGSRSGFRSNGSEGGQLAGLEPVAKGADCLYLLKNLFFLAILSLSPRDSRFFHAIFDWWFWLWWCDRFSCWIWWIPLSLHCLILSRHPPGVHNSFRKSSCHFVIFSVMPFLPGKGSFYFSFKSTFVALLRVCSFAAVCFGCILRTHFPLVRNEVPFVCHW